MPRWNGGVIGAANNPTSSSAKGIWSLSEATKAIRAGLWPPSNAGADPYFENVTLLLPGDGTNGAQNNTFLDSSTNGFTITRNGNTTQGTFSPFSKVDGRWGNYFDGASDYLTVPSTSGQLGSGNFTLEAWIYPIARTSTYPAIFNNYTSYAAGSLGLFAGHGTGTTTKYQLGINGATFPVIESTDTITYNSWTHIAVVRNSGVITLYINGVANGTYSTSATLNGTAGASWIGAAGDVLSTSGFHGYISNFRIVTGTAVYTAAFTPSTAPLTAITNTSLLTCQSNRFIDNSTNAFAITRNGDVAVTTFSPFPSLTAYAAGTNGGSGYFDGSGDYLYVASASAQTPFNMGTGDYTTEMWAYFNSVSGYQCLIDYRTSDTTGQGFILYTNGSTLYMYYNGSNRLSYSTVLTGTWYHIAVVKSSGVYALYINGVQSGATWSNTDSIAAPANRPIIGTDGTLTPFPFNGYIAGTRITKGGALYTSTFTPPTAPPTTTVSSGTVSLLCNYTNGGIIDTSMSNDLETGGNAQISTTQSKWGGASMKFDGTTDYLYKPSDVNLTLGSGDFTVEMWVYPTTTASTQFLFGMRPATTNGAYPVLYFDGSGTYWYVSSANRITGSVLSTNTWTHVAVARSGSSTKMFFNGTQVGSTYTDSTSYLMGWLIIGASDYNSGSTESLNGYIDDFRITKGVARYTTNFTAPSGPFNGFGD